MLASDADVVARRLGARVSGDVRESYRPSWNVAPTATVLGVVARDDGRLLDTFGWGLIPPWAPDPSRAGRMINARAETVARAPAYRSALRGRRLVVPADGFFEWRSGPDGRRRPLLFERADGAPLHFAGLWERWWPEGRDGSPVRTLTIMTTGASADLEGVHDRMPVVLDAEGVDDWLEDGALGPLDLQRLLRPAPAGTLTRRPVDPRVGDVRNDFAALVDVFEEPPKPPDQGPPEALRLFD